MNLGCGISPSSGQLKNVQVSLLLDRAKSTPSRSPGYGDTRTKGRIGAGMAWISSRPPTSLSVSYPSPRAAFTLIEMVISGALMTIILASAYLCLSSGLSSQKVIESRADAIQRARVAMAMMSADLRAACPISKDYDFLGMKRSIGDVEADNLDFATHHYTPTRPQEGDYCVLSYFLQKDPQSGDFTLCRRRLPFFSPEPLSGGAREEITRGLRGLRFEYYDGYEWYDNWGEPEGHSGQRNPSASDAYNLYGLPEAVRITLWMDPGPPKRNKSSSPDMGVVNALTNEPPLVFKTLVRLNLAAGALGAASSGSSSNAPSSSPGNSTGRPGSR